jgi:hypothetical protein
MHALDTGHELTKARLGRVAKLLLVVGGLLVFLGLVAYGTVFFRPTSDFFADPMTVMDENKRMGFVGVACFGLGWTLIAVGGGTFFFTYTGRMLRFTAAETAPVAKEVFNDVAKGTTEGVTAIARAVKKGLDRSPPEVVKVRCRSCRHLEAEDATVCGNCGKAMA